MVYGIGFCSSLNAKPMISHGTEPWEEHDVCARPNPTGPEVILVLKKQFFWGGFTPFWGHGIWNGVEYKHRIGHDRTIPCWILAEAEVSSLGAGAWLAQEFHCSLNHFWKSRMWPTFRASLMWPSNCRLPKIRDDQNISKLLKCNHTKHPRNVFHSISGCFRPTNFREQLSLPPLDHGPIPHRPADLLNLEVIKEGPQKLCCGELW